MNIKKAMRLYPIEHRKKDGVNVNYYNDWYLNGKCIWDNGIDWWCSGDGPTSTTESKAVAWLIEGAERKPLEPVTLIFSDDKQRVWVKTTPAGAQKLCDQLYRAGYRPNKGKE